MNSHYKISIIGAGQIGTVLCHLAAMRQLGDVVLYDIIEDLPQGKVLDLMEASRIGGFDVTVTGTNNYEDIRNSNLVIVTAGVPRKPGMSRDDLLSVNAEIIRDVAENVREFSPGSIVILISNPLDAMVMLFQKVSGFCHNRVLGQAGVLDSSRFCTFIAWELGVSVKDVNAMVLGGHGDSMVPLVHTANVNGIPVIDLLIKKYDNKKKAYHVMESLIKRTRLAGGEIVQLLKTGSAFFSPAMAAIIMAEAILRDEKRILPVCAYLNGEYNVNGYYMGVPAMLGISGVEKIVEVLFNKEEEEAFSRSADHVKQLISDMTKLNLM